MIEFSNVTKFKIEHGRKRFLFKDASFVIPDKARVVYLSNNRTDGMTFLNMLMGVTPTDAGRITTNSKLSWIVGNPIGLADSLSARKNINIICGINGIGRDKSHKIVKMIASFTGLDGHIDDPMNTYKKEMIARVSFSLSLALRFDYFLVANKTSVGTGEYKKKSHANFLKVIEKSGMILGAANIKLARSICDSSLNVVDGEVRYYDDLKEGISAFREYTRKNNEKAARRKKSKVLTRKRARNERENKKNWRNSVEIGNSDPS